MDLRTNPGRYLAVLAIGAPSALAVFERLPKQLLPDDLASKWNGAHWQVSEGRWIHALALRARERLPDAASIPEIIERTRRVLTSGDVAEDAALVVDVADEGQAVAQLVHGLRLRANCFRMGGVGEAAGLSGGARPVPERDLASDLRLAMQEGRLVIADALPQAHGIVEELTRGDLTSTAVRAVAFGVWFGSRTGHGPVASRLAPKPGTPEHDLFYSLETRDLARQAREARRRPWWKGA